MIDKAEIVLELIQRLSGQANRLNSSARTRISDRDSQADPFEEGVLDEQMQVGVGIYGLAADADRQVRAAQRVLSNPPARQNPRRVGVGSIVYLGQGEQTSGYFILPCGCGETVSVTGDGIDEVFVMNPEAPLAQELLGRQEHENLEFNGTNYSVLKIE